MITYVSFYTDDEVYSKHVQRLTDSLQKFNLQYDVLQVEKHGDWISMVNYKPTFCKQMLEKYKSPIVWVDADAEIVEEPVLFDVLIDVSSVDLAVCYRERPKRGKELLTGTLYLAYNDKIRALLDTWENMCRSRQVDQVCLQNALMLHTDVTVFELPFGYTKIFDATDMDDGHSMIVHHQASREA